MFHVTPLFIFQRDVGGAQLRGGSATSFWSQARGSCPTDHLPKPALFLFPTSPYLSHPVPTLDLIGLLGAPGPESLGAQ